MQIGDGPVKGLKRMINSKFQERRYYFEIVAALVRETENGLDSLVWECRVTAVASLEMPKRLGEKQRNLARGQAVVVGNSGNQINQISVKKQSMQRIRHVPVPQLAQLKGRAGRR